MIRLRASTIPRSSAILSALAVFLALVVVWRSQLPPRLPHIEAAMERDDVEVSGSRNGAGIKAPPPLSQFSDAVNRPLFNPSRQKFNPLAAQSGPTQAAAQSRPFPTFAVLGIAMSGSNRLALVKGPADKDGRHLRVGDVYEGWAVVDIHIDAVVLSSGAERREVPLRIEGQSAGAISSPRSVQNR